MRILTHTKEGKMCSKLFAVLLFSFSSFFFLFHSIVNMSFFIFYLYSFEKLLLSHTQRDYHNSRMLLITISKLLVCDRICPARERDGWRLWAHVEFIFASSHYVIRCASMWALGFFCAVLESFPFKINSLLCFEHSTMRAAVSTTMMMTRHKERYGNGKLS